MGVNLRKLQFCKIIQSLLLVSKKVSANNTFNMKLELFQILASYLVISFCIKEFFYGRSHLYGAKLQEDILGQVPKHLYKHSLSVLDSFHIMEGAPPSEIRKFVSGHISMVASIFKNTCEAWNHPQFNKYKSCKLSGLCSLHGTFEKMFDKELTTEKYLTKIQEIFDNHFDYWDFLLVAYRADHEFLSHKKGFTYLKAEIQENIFKKLPIDSNENELQKEMKNAFNIFLDLIESYYECLEQIPELKKMSIRLGQILNDVPIEIKLHGLAQENALISVSEALQQFLNQLYLQLCLNNHQMIYINSIVSVFRTFWFFQVGIMIIFCFFPIVPLWIVLTFEIIWGYIYGKLFGNRGSIRKRLPILTILLSKSTEHITKIPKFDNMRMYKRRRRKIISNS